MRIPSIPSRKLELSHIVKSLNIIFNGFQFYPLLGCYKVWQPPSEAIPAPIWLSEHKWPILGFWHSEASSLRKLVRLVPLIVPPHPYKSPGPFCSPPQHEAATIMLRSRGAIRWVMSCARFLPHTELCFMTESTVSISSQRLFCLLLSSRVSQVPFLPSPGKVQVLYLRFRKWPSGHSVVQPRFIK